MSLLLSILYLSSSGLLLTSLADSLHIRLSLCIFLSPVFPCPFTACQLLSAAVETTDKGLGHPSSEWTSMSEPGPLPGHPSALSQDPS